MARDTRNRGGKRKVSKNIATGVAHVNSSFNNTKILISDVQGNAISWSSAGTMGFKGSRKSTPYAAQMAAEDAGRKAQEHGVRTLEVEVQHYSQRFALTLMVACYNEQPNVHATLETVERALDELPMRAEVLVIDDASTDGTADEVQRFMADHPAMPVRLVRQQFNQGLSQSYIDGAFLGRGRWYRLVCGDNVEPVATLTAVLQKTGEADMIVPYHVQCEGRTALRRLLSRGFTVMVNCISGYRLRYYNGLPVLRRQDVMRWHGNYRGFGFQADLITRLLDEGRSCLEVPVTARDRQAGESKALTAANLASVAHFLLDLTIRRAGRIMMGRRTGRSVLEAEHQLDGRLLREAQDPAPETMAARH